MSTVDEAALKGLQQCSRYDLPRYKAAINQTRQTCWQSYYPFLYFQGQHRSNRLLITEDAGSVCIFRQRYERDGSTLMLFQLPMPFQPEVLERCLQRTMDHNGTAKVSIFRIDAEDKPLFANRPHTRLGTCPDEYIFAPKNYQDLSGGNKGNLRRSINKFQRRDDVEVLDYHVSYQNECMAVMDQWQKLQEEKYGEVLFRGYTQTCLKQYERFPRSDLFGKVIRSGGQIRSFGFGGEIRRGMGSIFITYSDHSMNGLNEYLNYCLLREMESQEFVNASNDGGNPGLRHAKQGLGPVSLHPLYQVYFDRLPVSVAVPENFDSTHRPRVNFKDRNGIRSLHLGSDWKMGIMRLDAPNGLEYDYTQRMMGWLLFVEPDSVKQKHVMQFGLGAGSLTKFSRTVLNMKTTAIELNPQVVALCRQSFALPPNDEKLQVIEGDAALFAKDPAWAGKVDALQVDLYDEDAAMPLFDNAAFYADCRTRLTKSGFLVINVFGRASNVSKTLEKVATSFGRLAVWAFEPTRSGNTVVLAQYTPSRPTESEFAARANEIQARWGLPTGRWLTRFKPLA